MSEAIMVLSKKLIAQETDICVKVFHWELRNINFEGQTGEIFYTPFLTLSSTTKLINPSILQFSTPGFVEFLEDEFKKLDRVAAVSINVEDENYSSLINVLSRNGFYPESTKGSAMIYNPKLEAMFKTTATEINLHLVNDEKDLLEYTEIFNNCFFEPGDDQIIQNSYQKIIQLSFEKNDFYSAQNYILSSPNFPGKRIGCITFVSDKNGAAKIYNVAMLPEFRRQGLAFSMLKKLIQEWFDSSPKDYLAIETEADSDVERLYTKLGFERVCLQENWVKG